MTEDKMNYMYGDHDHPDMNKDDFWSAKGVPTYPMASPAEHFDYNHTVGLRERIAMMLMVHAGEIDEDEAFRLAKRLETWVIEGDTGDDA